MCRVEAMLPKHLVGLCVFLSKRIFLDTMVAQELSNLHRVCGPPGILYRVLPTAERHSVERSRIDSGRAACTFDRKQRHPASGHSG